MASTFPLPHSTAVLPGVERDSLRFAICPMCHTSATLSQGALDAGGDWRCVRCGQHWDASRVAVVTAYAAWAADHDRIVRPAGDVSGERLGVTP
ncbi:MAG: hypothetical protein HOP16_11745 [Acidobacteria bacterium]|nr:hypothetical protein [Acidobacteriota bacterium]